jgi:superfamily II DNA or RNA helicase
MKESTPCFEIQLPPLWKFHFKNGAISAKCLASVSKVTRGQFQLIPSRATRTKSYLLTQDDGIKVLVYTGSKPTCAKNFTHVISTDAITIGTELVTLGHNSKWVTHPEHLTDPASVDSTTRDDASKSWRTGINYLSEEVNGEGLRSPQLGALHSIASHWTLGHSPGIVVMPTGTGKTEVMLATAVAAACKCVLVIVPSDALRSQTAAKFETLGILKKFGIVPDQHHFPVVARLHGCPKTEGDLRLFDSANVIVSTMQALSGAPSGILDAIAAKCSHIFFDEAHHTPADSWERLKRAFSGRPILQFTATPFRRDGKRLDGKILFNYPLAKAQKENYFKPIHLEEVWEWDDDVADSEIARIAVETLRRDIANNLDHMVMARAETIDRAKKIFDEYYSKHQDLNPVLVYQGSPNRRSVIEAIKNRNHRIVVCVDMLGEGFDLPNLKISAIHDAHRSLGVTLQFAGRFTRSNLPDIGDATVIVNLANQRMSEDLDELYSENADWNSLLAKLSNDAIDPQVQFSEFHEDVKSMVDEADSEPLSDRMLAPKTSTVVYRTDAFSPNGFVNALHKEHDLIGSWQNQAADVIMFVVKRNERLAWAKTKAVTDQIHDLIVIYHDKAQRLLFIHSSAKNNQKRIAQAVGRNVHLIQDEDIFRVLGRIDRLMFYSAGLRGGGRGSIRFQMLSGTDVAQAIDPAIQQNSTKSNLFGVGYEDGHRVSIGCSRKGTIWAMQSTSIPDWRKWCIKIGSKLLDKTISTQEYLAHTLVPKVITTFPTEDPICIDWPNTLYQQLPKAATFSDGSNRFEWIECDLELTAWSTTTYDFKVVRQDGTTYEFTATLDPTHGATVTLKSPIGFRVQLGSERSDAADFFTDHQPVIRMPDGGLIEGNRILRPNTKLECQMDLGSLLVKDWTGVELTTESLWKNGTKRANSVQGFVIDQLLADPETAIVFDDDDAGEIADVISIVEKDGEIHVHLYHCKFAGNTTSGSRASDLYVVCGQAQKGTHWAFGFEKVAMKMVSRENKSRNGRDTRFHKGDLKTLDRIRRQSRKTRVTYYMTIVQPGLSKSKMKNEHSAVLGATSLFLKQHLATELAVWVDA